MTLSESYCASLMIVYRDEASKEVKSMEANKELRNRKWIGMPNLAYALVYYMYKGGEHPYALGLPETIRRIFSKKQHGALLALTVVIHTMSNTAAVGQIRLYRHSKVRCARGRCSILTPHSV